MDIIEFTKDILNINLTKSQINLLRALEKNPNHKVKLKDEKINGYREFDTNHIKFQTKTNEHITVQAIFDEFNEYIRNKGDK